MHIPCTFHAHSMRPSVLGPTRLELLKVTPHCGIPLLCEVFSARPSCVFFAGQLRSPAEHLSTILLSAVCLLERTCGFHASLLQDAFRIKFELPVTTWETSNHLCTLQELAVFMEARYPAELLWPTRDIDLSTVVLYKELSAAEVSTSASPLAICTKFIGCHFLSFLKPIKLFKAKLASIMGNRGGSGEDLKCQLNSSAPSTFIQ
jgi:hypothetical protein